MHTRLSKRSAAESSDRASNYIPLHKESSLGKLTKKKDFRLHKLVFMDGNLPNGTEVAYRDQGKKILIGHIKDSAIYCNCCETVVSPSQFEAHAGWAQRRKPYNYIYTSKDVSLHEIAVSLSIKQKLPTYETGRVAGVDPTDQIIKQCSRIVTAPETDLTVCVLCRCHDFSSAEFDQRTVLLCDQCEKEYHVGCLKEHNMGDLQELPEGEWFCSDDCSRIHAAMQDLVLRGSEPLQNQEADTIRKKRREKGLDKDAAVDVRCRLLSGKNTDGDNKFLLTQVVSLFKESFDPVVEVGTGHDLIPFMVKGENVRGQDFGGFYCAVLTVNSSVVSAGVLRILGCDVAELPLVATRMECQGQGCFRSLFQYIERLLASLNVKHFVLPAADEALPIWTKKFGFSKLAENQLKEGSNAMIFQGTSMLHKLVSSQGNK